MKKRIISLITLIACLACSICTSVVSADEADTDIYIDGNLVCRGQQGKIPVCVTFEAMGYDVRFENGKAYITDGMENYVFESGKSEAKVNGAEISVGSAAELKDGDLIIDANAIKDILKIGVAVSDSKTVISTYDKDDWWYKYPTQAVESYSAGVGSAATNGNYGADFGWGSYTQRLSYEEYKDNISRQKSSGKKLLGYMEGSGTVGTYALGFETEPNDSYKNYFRQDSKLGLKAAKRPSINIWGLDYYRDNAEELAKYPIKKYTGIHSTINSEDIAKPYYTLDKSGYEDVTYPNGDSAEGYLEEAEELPYPLNAKFYDAMCAKGLDGTLYTEFEHTYTGDGESETEKLQRQGLSYFKTSGGEKTYFGFANMSKDTAAPFWKSYNRQSMKNMVKFGLDGLWVDNYSVWDNFSKPSNSYGNWSEYEFNKYLKNTFSAEELNNMGISDTECFNIREYMKNSGKAATDSEWLNDRIWTAYKIFKKNAGSEYLKNIYRSAKEESQNKADGFAVMGNDVNLFNHGWVQSGWLDMCGTETPIYALPMLGNGIGRVDEGGRLGVLYKTYSQTAKGPYSAPWVYVREYADKTELGKVWLAEAFANGSVIKKADDTAGSPGSHLWLNDFISRYEKDLAPRYEAADIAVVYSPLTQLADAFPNDFLTDGESSNYHYHGVLGFEHAMIDANVPFKILPEWKLNKTTAKLYKTIVVPNVEVMDDETVEVLKNYVKNGGRLVITGSAAMRKGEDGQFEIRNQNPLSEYFGIDLNSGSHAGERYSVSSSPTFTEIAAESGSIAYSPEPVGYGYYTNKSDRETMRSAITEVLGATANDIINAGGIAPSINTYVWKNAGGTKTYIDVVNCNADAVNDTVTEAENVTFEVAPPKEGLKVSARVISPDDENAEVTAVYNENSGKYEITLPHLKVYSIVILDESGADKPDNPPEPVPELDGYDYAENLSDEFNGENDKYVWVNEQLHNADISDGHLNIHSYVPGANSSENIMYTKEGITEDFVYEVKFKPNTVEDNQEVGIYLYDNWSNKQNFAVVGKGNNYIIVNHDGNTTGWPQIIPNAKGYVFLKAEKSDGEYIFSYSSDGMNYTEKFRKKFGFESVHFGMYAQYTQKGSAYPTTEEDSKNFTASFDWARVYKKRPLSDQKTINVLPEDKEDSSALYITSVTPRENIKAGQSLNIKFNNKLADIPIFSISKNNKVVMNLGKGKENADGTYSAVIPQDAKMEENEIYTLYAESKDIYGNEVKNNAGFRTYKALPVDSDTANKYDGYVYDVYKSEEFNDGKLPNGRKGAFLSVSDGSMWVELNERQEAFDTAETDIDGDFVAETRMYIDEAMRSHDQNLVLNLISGNKKIQCEWRNNDSAGYLFTTKIGSGDVDWPVLDANRQIKELYIKVSRKGNNVEISSSSDGKSWTVMRKGELDGAITGIQVGGYGGVNGLAGAYDYIRVYVPQISGPKLDRKELTSGAYTVTAQADITDFVGEKSAVLIVVLYKKSGTAKQLVECGSASAEKIIGTKRIEASIDVNIDNPQDYEIKTFLWDSLQSMRILNAERGKVKGVRISDVVFGDTGVVNAWADGNAAHAAVTVTDINGNLIYIDEADSEKLEFMPGPNAENGIYSLKICGDGKILQKDFKYIKNTGKIMEEINAALGETDSARLKEIVKANSDIFDLSYESKISDTVFAYLKQGGNYSGIDIFCNELDAAITLEELAAAETAAQIMQLTEKSDIFDKDLADEVSDKAKIYEIMKNDSRRSTITAQKRNIAEKVYRSAIGISLINETTTESRSAVKNILEKYKEDFELPKYDLSESEREKIAFKLAGFVIGGGKTETHIGLKEKLDGFVAELKNENKGTSTGGGTSSSSGKGSLMQLPTDISKVAPNKDYFADMGSVPWAIEYINYLYENGIVNGTGNRTFSPLENVTREQFVKMICIAYGIEKRTDKKYFADADETAWYTPYINGAKKSGIVNGISDTVFGVGENITREDMTVIMLRAAELSETIFISDETPDFEDSDSISAYARKYVAYAQKHGIVNGTGERKFEPKAYATRAEAAKMIGAERKRR